MTIECVECGHFFEVPTSMRGGLANCPKCERATQVPGGMGALYWFIIALGVALVLFVSLFVQRDLGLLPALVVLGIGGFLIAVFALAA